MRTQSALYDGVILSLYTLAFGGRLFSRVLETRTPRPREARASSALPTQARKTQFSHTDQTVSRAKQKLQKLVRGSRAHTEGALEMG